MHLLRAIAALLIGLGLLAGAAPTWAQEAAPTATEPQTLVADFTASPLTGAAPLTVTFVNLSFGNYTASLWDFGDGATSTATHPVHVYAAPGVYTVTLTVSNESESATVRRPGFVRVLQRLHFPVAMAGYDPLLYDNFNNPAYDGSYNGALWSFSNPTTFQARQENGAMVFTSSPAPGASGSDLVLRRPPLRTWQQVQHFEGKLKISSDRSGGWSSVQLVISSSSVAGRGWFTQCYVGGRPTDARARFGCEVAAQENGVYVREYSRSVWVDYDAWQRVKIEADPQSGALRFFLNGELFDAYTPADAAALVTARNLRPAVGVWNGAGAAFSTRYADDIMITPAP